jgi:tricorn protease
VKQSLLVVAALAAALAGVPCLAKEPVKLVSNPSLSPDGSTLLFSWNGDIWAVASSGGTAQPLTNNEGEDAEPKFSPDGTRIAFISDRGAGRQAFVISSEGGPPEQATWHTAGYNLMGWFPDGNSLLVTGQRDHFWSDAERFFRVPVGTRAAEALLFDDYGSDGSLSADGKRLLYVREGPAWWRKGYRGAQAAQVWMYDLDARSHTKLLDPDMGATWPMWKPDGKGFYYVGGQGGAFNLYEYELESKTSKQLTTYTDDGVVFPCISRDGSTLAFRQLFDVYRFRPGTGEAPVKIEITAEGDLLDDPIERRILTTATDAVFSDDGLDIFFVAGGDLWVMDTELKEPRQITDTAEEERDPVLAPSGDELWFVSDKDGQCDVWKASRSNADKYWWQNSTFKLDRLTQDAEVESDLQWSPEGSRVAFVKGLGDLWTMAANGSDAKRLLASWNAPDYDWSPDGKWITYAVDDNDFNRDVWVVPLDGSREPFNVSRHPDNEAGPKWSPDGRLIAFTGRRMETEVDLYFVWLREEDDQKDSRERTLEKALDKVNKARKKNGPPAAPGAAGAASKPGAEPPMPADPGAPSPPAAPAPPNAGQPPAGQPASGTSSTPEAAAPSTDSKNGAKSKVPEVQIDFDRLHDRIRRVSIPDSMESNLIWSHDSKKLAFSATVNGTRGTYSIEFPDQLTPKLLASQTGTGGKWIAAGDQIVWVAGGAPATLTGAGRATEYRVRVRQASDRSARFAAVFDQCWRTMRDNYYDERLGNRNWDAIRRKYVEMAAAARDMDTVVTVVQMMLGELNGSHLGFIAMRGGLGPGGPPPIPGAPAAPADPQNRSWTVETPHLGLRFVLDYKGPGLKVRDVLPEGPADEKSSRILPGEIVTAIDGTTVDPEMDLTTVLNGVLDRDIVLSVRSEMGQDRQVVIRPISYRQVRDRLYEKWIDDNQKAVSQASEGRLGYLHIRQMDTGSFLRFEEELYSVGAGKDGLVIDVRENGGGSTADHLLTALTQPVHAITVPRGGGSGYPQDRKVYATWNKPIVVLCNQNSYSNAEIFSHAVRTLNRGQVVGVPTAGAVISTGGTAIMGEGFLRLPFRGWYVLASGEDMELNGAVPHHVLWPEPGQMTSGKDVQLEKAVEVLLADVKAWQSRPQPALRKATER